MGVQGRRHGEALEPLTDALGSKNDDVRKCAVNAVMQIATADGDRPQRLVPALIGYLKDPDEKLRAYAASALGRLDNASVPALIKGVQSTDDAVRARAAQVLGTMALQGRRHAEALPSLREAMRSDNAEVRRAAAEAVNHIVGESR
jgi:HEAT repeat protein